ncbi:MAG TPA: alpha/beta fold hydrolase [Stenomitos sp.]
MSLIVQGVDVFVRESGCGEPILFLHGNPDSADLWNDIIFQLHESYRCIAIDLPGFGRTKAPQDFDYSFENLGDFVNALVESLNITTPLNVVAHDFGGAFAMSWAARNPQKVRSIVVINHPFFVAEYKWHFGARVWRTPLVGELSMFLINWPVFSWMMRSGNKNLSKEQIRHAYLVLSQSRWQILRLYRAPDPEEFKRWEPQMLAATAKIPTLVLWGNQDSFIPEWVADKFGSKRVTRFQESGHWLPAEIPEQVAAELLKFLKL